MEWSCEECRRQGLVITAANQRKVLGKCLKDLKLSSFCPEDIANVVYPSRLFTDLELLKSMLASQKVKLPDTNE